MSRPGSAILVIERGACTEPVRGEFPDLFPATEATSRRATIAAPELNSVLRSSPTGYDILTFYYSGHFAHTHPHDYRSFLNRVINLGSALGAIFGFVTTHDGQLGDRWLENEIISPLLAGDKIEESRIGAELILIANP